MRRAASALQALGLVAGDRVAVLLPRGLDEAVSLLAVMAAGGVAVPLHGKLKDDQVRHVLRDAAPRLCITDAERAVGLRDPGEVLGGQRCVDPATDFAGALPAAPSAPVSPA